MEYTQVNLLKFIAVRDSSEVEWIVHDANGKEVRHPDKEETRLVNCFVIDNDEVMLVLNMVILFLDRDLNDRKALRLDEIDRCG